MVDRIKKSDINYYFNDYDRIIALNNFEYNELVKMIKQNKEIKKLMADIYDNLG